jgi:hypothetical protein
MRLTVTIAGALIALAAGAAGCGDGHENASAATPPPRPLPSPVSYRPDPEGITLADPAFEPLPGARADYGRLGGAVYQIEIPDDWNGRLVLHMHGFEEFASQARATAPDFRRYLIGHGYAWGASSFSSTGSIPGRSADETAALWDHFARQHGRPVWTYATGISMGGAASHIAAERYGDRFDGALAFCGNATHTAGFKMLADYFAAGAYVAGITQAEFDAANDAAGLIPARILPALQDPILHERFENILIDLTGGPRWFDREGFHLEEETNWRRTQLLVLAGIAPNAGTVYRLGPSSDVDSDEFNRAVIRLPINDELLHRFLDGNDTPGDLQVPVLSVHSTGDGQVPIEHARILQRNVDAAGKSDRLVQRVIRDPSHCGFTTLEMEDFFAALVGWVERGAKPDGENVLVDDLRTLGGRFELTARPGTPQAAALPGAADRVTVSGMLSLDGAPFDARFLGAVVRKDGRISPCQYTLTSVDDGGYEIVVSGDAEVSGCGTAGAEILLWTFAQDQKLYSFESVAWPGNGGSATLDARFSTAAPRGSVPPVTEFAGEVYDEEGSHLPPGTRVEAYVGDVLCGVASTRRGGNFVGYILSVVGPEAIRGCERDATIAFLVDGRPALETAVNHLGSGGGLDLTVD